MIKVLVIAGLVFISLIFSPGVFAETVDVSGNGAGSNNVVNINQTNTNTVNQSNTSNINNKVDVNCNTGGNSSSGNTGGNTNTSTGDCSANVNVTNCVNSNNGSLNCPKPGVSPTPVPSTGGPVNGQSSGGGGGGGNGGGGSSGGKSPEILGSTGSAHNLLIASLGFAFLIGGLVKFSFKNN